MKNIKIIVKKNQEKVVPFVWINGKEEKVLVDVRLAGEGAKVTIVGIFVGNKTSSVVFNTRVVHEARQTKSLTTLRGVFFDTALFNNDGMVRINKGAKNADGYFASKVLLFDDAKGRSVPSLEIDENELKAGHASTVGRPDEQQMFYLQSRGLSEKEAERLIVSGFFEPVIRLLPKDQQALVQGKITKTI